MGRHMQATLQFLLGLGTVTALAACVIVGLWSLQHAAGRTRPLTAHVVKWMRIACSSLAACMLLALPFLVGHQGMGLSVLLAGMAATTASKVISAGVLYTPQVMAVHPSAYQLLKASFLDTIFPGSLVPQPRHGVPHAAQAPRWAAAAPLTQQLRSCIVWGTCYEASCVAARVLLDSAGSEERGSQGSDACPLDLRACGLVLPTMLVVSLSVGCAQMLQFIAGHHAACVLITLVQRMLRPQKPAYLPPLPMDAPWAAHSVQNLWARWHQYFRGDLLALGAWPARKLILAVASMNQHSNQPINTADLADKAVQQSASQHVHNSQHKRRLAQAGSVLAAFVVSGVIHEYMCFAGLGAATGAQLLFFAIHGAAVLAEGALAQPRTGQEGQRAQGSSNGWWGPGKSLGIHRLAVVLFCVMTAPAFAWPWVVSNYIHQMPTPAWDMLQAVRAWLPL